MSFAIAKPCRPVERELVSPTPNPSLFPFRVGVSTFLGTVQAHSTASTRFRVVWRGDTFTTRDDAKATTMLSHSQPFNSRGPREGARFHSDPALSRDDDDLAVPREDACHLAAWAKSEFPSVVSTDSRWRHQTAPGTGEGAGAEKDLFTHKADKQGIPLLHMRTYVRTFTESLLGIIILEYILHVRWLYPK